MYLTVRCPEFQHVAEALTVYKQAEQSQVGHALWQSHLA
jgi:hypothetical protein